MSDIWKYHRLSMGPLELICLPGIGGRLWDIRFHDQSLLFQNPDLNNVIPDLTNLADLPTRSPQFGFPLWGGEKTWIAPDRSWPDGGPHPALDSAPYDLLDTTPHTLRMLSQKCPVSHLQVEREISLSSGSTFSIIHRVTNLGDSARFTGIWSVMMLRHPAQIGLSASQLTEITPIFGDSSGRVVRGGSAIVFDCNTRQEFKSGINTFDGRVMIRMQTAREPMILTSSTPAPERNTPFAHDQAFEVFNSGDYPYCEAEWHAPVQDLRPGESQTFRQDFSVQREATVHTNGSTRLTDLELLSCMC